MYPNVFFSLVVRPWNPLHTADVFQVLNIKQEALRTNVPTESNRRNREILKLKVTWCGSWPRFSSCCNSIIWIIRLCLSHCVPTNKENDSLKTWTSWENRTTLPVRNAFLAPVRWQCHRCDDTAGEHGEFGYGTLKRRWMFWMRNAIGSFSWVCCCFNVYCRKNKVWFKHVIIAVADVP